MRRRRPKTRRRYTRRTRLRRTQVSFPSILVLRGERKRERERERERESRKVSSCLVIKKHTSKIVQKCAHIILRRCRTSQKLQRGRLPDSIAQRASLPVHVHAKTIFRFIFLVAHVVYVHARCCCCCCCCCCCAERR